MDTDAADGGGHRRGNGGIGERPGLGSHLRRFLSEFTGGGDTSLVGHLEAQIGAALRGATVATEAIIGGLDSAQARETMGEVEHAGDAERALLIARLHQSFMTPIDREDLFRLSRSIDDVLDNLRDFVREVDLMKVHEDTHFPDILRALTEGLQQLNDAVHQIVVEIVRVPTSALAAKKASNHIRQLYQVAIADLLAHDEVTMDLLKKRELLRRLDVVGLRLGEAADALADGAMKRSH